MTMIKKMMPSIAVALLIWAGLANSTLAKPYKGAEIFTSQGVVYGKFVVRVKAAKASGVISNFFLWKDGSELDSIFWEEVDVEIFGKNNATSWQSNIITGLGNKTYSEQVHQSSVSFADNYHTFVIEWTPNQVRWLVDGQVIRTTNGGQASSLVSPAQFRINFWPPNNPGWVGNWSDNVLPLHMFVNWAELYTWNNGQFTLQWRDDFDYFDQGRWATADWTFEENRADFSPNNVVVRNGYLVLAMTREGQEGYQGNPPVDNQVVASSSSSKSSVASSSSSSSRPSSSSVASSSSSSSASNPTPVGGSLNIMALLSILLLLVFSRKRSI